VILLFLIGCMVGIVFWIVRQWEDPPMRETDTESDEEFWRAW
jgi:hypothetical protein